MTNFFTQPYKPVERPKDKFLSILVFGGFIFLFLFIFSPFGLNRIESIAARLLLSAGFGVVTIFMLLVFKYLVDPLIVRRNWTLAKNLLYDFFVAACIGVANYFYITLIFRQEFVFLHMLISMWTAVMVGILPVTISYFITFNAVYRKALKDADIPPPVLFPDEEFTLTAGYQRNNIRLRSGDLVYICSNDNYVTIVTSRGGTIEKQTIRGTLKAVEKELAGKGSFLKCHKCYIVNTAFAEGLTGNSRNLSIRLKLPDMHIPVARSHSAVVISSLKK
jgi:hypothetical protein